MSGRHPTDEVGLVLPLPGWPVDRQASGELELVRRFLNSVNRESGGERFRTPAGLDAWLESEGAQPVGASAGELAALIAVREALHGLVRANAGSGADPHGWEALRRAVANARFEPALIDGRLRLTATGSPTDRLTGRIVLAVHDADRDGTWARLKACSRCQWVVYDPSKNRSSRWCSMSACGGRHNARQYRARHPPAPPA